MYNERESDPISDFSQPTRAHYLVTIKYIYNLKSTGHAGVEGLKPSLRVRSLDRSDDQEPTQSEPKWLSILNADSKDPD